MFEKDIEELFKKKPLGYEMKPELEIYKDGFKDGYNKANEWHYNGVPENENDILCQIDKDIFVVGYFHQKNKQYYTTSGEWLETVIAWKEIILPKEIKEWQRQNLKTS